jgi:hypothetical protein
LSEAFIILISIESIESGEAMSQSELTTSEARFLQETLRADHKIGAIRLREGEYQYDLAKTIASFQLELRFPNVRDVITRRYGEERANDLPFVRKIQTILKKMEKSNIVLILPKKKPWELQKYVLSSFRFLDADNKLVVFATPEEIQQSENLLHSTSKRQKTATSKLKDVRIKAFVFASGAIMLYVASAWAVIEPTAGPIVFLIAFSLSVLSTLLLGRVLSQRQLHHDPP